jgi:hypothetical protein
MYGTNYGSVSGIIHLVARRPVVAAVIVLAAVTVAKVPTMPPPPPAPPTPAVVSVLTPEPTPEYAGSHKHTTYTCEYGAKDTPTNVCKATLDSIAEFLQNDSAATLVVTGDIKHVVAVRRYFVQGESKLGIEASRIKIAAENDGSNVVTIEQIP